MRTVILLATALVFAAGCGPASISWGETWHDGGLAMLAIPFRSPGSFAVELGAPDNTMTRWLIYITLLRDARPTTSAITAILDTGEDVLTRTLAADEGYDGRKTVTWPIVMQRHGAIPIPLSSAITATGMARVTLMGYWSHP